MNVNDASVFNARVVGVLSCAFGVNALDGVAQPVEFVATIGKRDLRNQQNGDDDENY